MALEVEKNISKFIEQQFPEFYRTEGEKFVAFVQAYYEWMESNNRELYHSRNLTDYRDIDNTIEDFILDFKNKYLSDIQFNVATNKRLFVKNALEFYRAKGTERAVDLFFKLVYGIEARVYEPSRDLFKLSDNEWEDKRYLEMVPSPTNINFIGRQIFGADSKASAFAERLIRAKKGNLYIEVIYLSALNGTFETNEHIYAYADDGVTRYRNEIIGSLTNFDITASDPNFIIGEEVVVEGGEGKKGRAIVTSIESEVGVVSFDMIEYETGWGYSADTQLIGADRMLLLDDVVLENTDYFYHIDPFQQFKTVHQDLALVYFDEDNSNTAAFTLGAELHAYYSDNTAQNSVFNCTVVEVNQNQDYIVINYTKADYLNSNNQIELDDGRLLLGASVNNFYTNTGAVLVVDSGAGDIVEASISGNVIATGNVFTIEYSLNDSSILISGDKLIQREDTNTLTFATVTVANTFSNTTSGQLYANVVRNAGFLRSNRNFIRQRTGQDEVYGSIQKIANVQVGIINNGTDLVGGIPFKKLANTYTSNTSLGSYARGSANNNSYSFTTKATIRGPEQFLEDTKDYFYYETTTREGGPFYVGLMDTDTAIGNLDTYDAASPQNSVFQWIAGGNTIQFSNTLIGDALNFTNTAIQVGSLDRLIVTNPGEGYGISPFYIAYDPLAFHTERYDFYIRYVSEGIDQDVLKAFRIGEIVRVGSSNAYGRVREFNVNTRELVVTRLHTTQDVSAYASQSQWGVQDDFRIGDVITGEASDISATIEYVDERRMHPRIGLNAQISTEALSGDGFATSVRIIDSGIGYFGRQLNSTTGTYVRGEPLTLTSRRDPTKTISVVGYLGENGIAPGVHPNRKSFLSSDKYLQDNDFYQEYSYQVLTALPFSKYKQTLIDVLHLAGSKPFGGYVGTSEASLDIDSSQTTDTWDIKNYGLFINQNTFYTANVA